MVALMTQCLSIKHGDKVLEIGTGSGYQMAILLSITSRVYSIERLPHLAERASETLAMLGYKNAFVKIGDGSSGWPEEAPFDGILVTSAAPSVPKPLIAQLADGGRLVIPIGSRHTQTLHAIIKKGSHYHSHEHTACVFVPLIGEYGWND
jgi:protein-L-isoaspartate(D-aspartate) O-methyltransferase